MNGTALAPYSGSTFSRTTFGERIKDRLRRLASSNQTTPAASSTLGEVFGRQDNNCGTPDSQRQNNPKLPQ